MEKEISYVRIRSNNNLAYLPLAYFLPEEMITRCPTLRKLPRCLGEVAASDNMIALINSDQLQNEIMDSIAALAFPHFGFAGWKEHYTGDFPVWKLSYSLPLWAKLLEEVTGWGLQMLLQTPSTEFIPFFDSAYINEAMFRVVKRGIEIEGWQPMLDVVREMPCDEDFEKVISNARIDFIRRWYHTRSKRVQTVSLEECLEDDEHGIYEIEDKTAQFEDTINSDDYVERFKARLSEKDMKILEMRVNGLTYEKIAQIMGYKNHSGIIKRIRVIAKEFEDYEELAHTFANRAQPT